MTSRLKSPGTTSTKEKEEMPKVKKKRKKGGLAHAVTDFNPSTGRITLEGSDREINPASVIGRPIEVKARPSNIDGIVYEGYFEPRGGHQIGRRDGKGNLIALRSPNSAIKEAAERFQSGSARAFWDRHRRMVEQRERARRGE